MSILFKYKFFISFFIIVVFVSCDGTLGGFNTVSFPVSKKKLEIALDSLYSEHPEYILPNKWEENNDWSKRGYDFLDSRIFYFKEEPEEMYYISFIGDKSTFKDTTHIDIAIRSVFIADKYNWFMEEDFNQNEIDRIELRFMNEIILKLEKYTISKSKILEK